MYENVDNFIPMIWEGDQHTSPSINQRKNEYNIAALPSSMFNGDSPDVGGGTGVLGRYEAIYADLNNVSSPMEIETTFSFSDGQVEVGANVSVTEEISNADDYRIIYILTNYFDYTYNSTVVRYYEEDYTLLSSGETGTFTHSFDIDPDWDLTNLRAIAIVQYVNTTGTTSAGSYNFNMYPILQAGYAHYPLSPVTPVEDLIMSFDEVLSIDLDNYFAFNGEVVDIDVTIENTDEQIVSTSVTDNQLEITALQEIGTAEITITGEYLGCVAVDVFEVQVISSEQFVVIFNLFDSYGDGWQSGGNINFIEMSDEYFTIENGSEATYQLYLLPGIYNYTYTATDNYGSENSWTINLADGTEIGSGAGGDNGTTMHSFTVGTPIVGTIFGSVTNPVYNSPIANATVSAGSFTTATDAAGNYSIIVNAGSYNVICSADDFTTQTVEGIEVLEEQESEVNFALEPVTGSMDPPEELTAEISGSDVILNWFAPGTSPVDSFEDDFESYEDFTFDLTPWTTIDVDGATVYGIGGYTFPNQQVPQSFIIFNPSSTDPPIDMTPHSGDKFAACFACQTPDNDDWMITPMVSIANGHMLSFWTKTYTDNYGLERYNVYVSTSGTDPSDFTLISGDTYLEAPYGEWGEFSYDLSDYSGQNIFVGIQCVSSDAFIFMVDDLTIGPAPAFSNFNIDANNVGTITERVSSNPTKTVDSYSTRATRDLTGYNIYRNDALIATVDAATLTYTDVEPPVGSHEYYVTAIYPAGESEPSNSASFTGIDDNNTLLVTTVLKGNFPNPFNPTTTVYFTTSDKSTNVSVEIFNLKGQKVKSLVNDAYARGNHSVVWNGKDDNNNAVSSGIFFYKMKTAEYTDIKKMILLK